MDRCPAGQVLVVDNKTVYAVQVFATEDAGRALVSPARGATVGTVLANTVDTLTIVGPPDLRRVGFSTDVLQASNNQQRLFGLHARCVSST